MNGIDKDRESKTGINTPQVESEPLEQGDARDTGVPPDEKPLEKMTKAELIQKVQELEEKSENSYDQYLRAKAEMDNLLKRNKREKEEWVKFSNESLIKELLPVIDNLEMAIAHSTDENSIHALREGVELTLKGLRDTLAKAGLEEVKAKGESFDPCFHHAVSEQEDETMEAGKVLTELQKGYTLHDRLVRPAMVVLSKGKVGGEGSHGQAPKRVCEE